MSNNMENEKQVVRSIHYLGSKLRMLDAITDAIDSVDPTGGPVCDLFSGSATVSKHLLQYRDVVSVDIQHYSKVLCEASTTVADIAISPKELVGKIMAFSTSQTILEAYSCLFKYEDMCMKAADEEDVIEPLYDIIENGSIYIFQQQPTNHLTPDLKNALTQTIAALSNKGLLDSPETTITRYFGGLYFSYRQAAILDCISSFIFSVRDETLKTKMLAALLSTASELVNTVGKQFAQPLKVRNSQGQLKSSLKQKITTDRTTDTMTSFCNWLEYYVSSATYSHTCNALCEDYVSALKKLPDYNIKAVYADPPYTRYHYSRYYHVLETICLRDNPPVSSTFPNGKGGISRAVYRANRHQSPFCIKSQAEHAFDLLFSGVKEWNIPLVLSYSPFDASKAVTPRLRTIDQLVDMAKKYYSSVEITSPGTFTHSKLNATALNFESNHEAELLIICK